MCVVAPVQSQICLNISTTVRNDIIFKSRGGTPVMPVTVVVAVAVAA